MKKHLSVLMLMVRSTFYKVLGIMILMCGVQFGMFALTLNRLKERGTLSLEYAVEKAWLVYVLVICCALIFNIIGTGITSKKSNTHYVLDRLQISENWIFFWQAVYNMLCFALLLTVQIITVLALCLYYVEFAGDDTVTHQTIFLAFYRSQFLHSLLPMDSMHSIIASILTVIVWGLSVTLACAAEKHKRSSFPAFAGMYTMLCLLRRETGDFLNDMIIYILSVSVIGYTIYFLLTKEARHGN